MEIHATRKDIGTWKTFETELCTVSSTTDWLHFRRYSIVLHRPKYNIYHVHIRVNLLLHVILLVVKFNPYGAFTILFIHLLHASFHEILAVFKLRTVVVTNDITEFCLLSTAFYA